MYTNISFICIAICKYKKESFHSCFRQYHTTLYGNSSHAFRMSYKCTCIQVCSWINIVSKLCCNLDLRRFCWNLLQQDRPCLLWFCIMNNDLDVSFWIFPKWNMITSDKWDKHWCCKKQKRQINYVLGGRYHICVVSSVFPYLDFIV